MSGLVAYNNCHLVQESDKIHHVPQTSNKKSEILSLRSVFAAVVLDGRIFVIGGFDGLLTFAYVECYVVDSSGWYEVSSLKLSFSALSACILAGLPTTKNICRIKETYLRSSGESPFY